MSWNISALIVWCTEVGGAQSRGMPAKGEWWTGLVLLGLLGVSLYTVLQWGWARDQQNKHKDPLEVKTLAIISTIVFGGLSLMVLYTQLAG
jgi:predicted membrane protein